MQIKTTVRYHLLLEWLMSRRPIRNAVVAIINWFILATMENSMEILKKLIRVELPYDLGIPVLGIYLKTMKTLVGKNVCHLYSLQHYLK